MPLPPAENLADVTLADLVAAAYQEAGHAVAEHCFGRELIRVACPPDDDPETLRRIVVARTPIDQARELEAQLFPWLTRVDELEAAGVLSGAEAEAARIDLWRPLRWWYCFQNETRGDTVRAAADRVLDDGFSASDAAAAERYETGLRRDLAAILAGGEAWRRHTGAPANPCWEDARQVAADLPPETRQRMLAWAGSRAEAIVPDRWPAVQALAAALVLYSPLDGWEAQAIITRVLAGGVAASADAGTERGWLRMIRSQFRWPREELVVTPADRRALDEVRSGLAILFQEEPPAEQPAR
jgi:hypothetical protein